MFGGCEFLCDGGEVVLVLGEVCVGEFGFGLYLGVDDECECGEVFWCVDECVVDCEVFDE